MKRLRLTLLLTLAMLSVSALLLSMWCAASGTDSPPPPETRSPTHTPTQPTPIDTDAIFYAEIEFQHDLDTARDMRLNVRVHPGGQFPGVTGGYIETTIRCHVRLRDVSVPKPCETAEARNGRPLIEIRRERSRWDASLEYTWSLLKLQKQVRLSNPVQVEPGVVECDIAFPLGGAWHDLAAALSADEHARIALVDGEWNWGSLNVKPY